MKKPKWEQLKNERIGYAKWYKKRNHGENESRMNAN